MILRAANQTNRTFISAIVGPGRHRGLHLLAVGLGNPPFKGSRHDAGCIALDWLIEGLDETFGSVRGSRTFKADKTLEGDVAGPFTFRVEVAGRPPTTPASSPTPQKSGKPVKGKQATPSPAVTAPPTPSVASDITLTVLRPTTYMNLSGTAVSRAIKHHRIDPSRHLLVFHDDVEMAFGKFDLVHGRSERGQKGAEDIRRKLASEYWRVRIGVGRPPKGVSMVAHVLSQFSPEEWTVLRETVQPAVLARVKNWVEDAVLFQMGGSKVAAKV